MSRELMKRRDFLRTSAGITLAAATGLGSEIFAGESPDRRARVVLIREESLFDEKDVLRRAQVEGMVDRSVSALFDSKKTDEVWRSLFGAKDIVGVKSNQWASLATPPELEQTLKARLEATGVSSKNISVRDRGVLEDPVFKKATALINVRPLRTHHWSGLGTCIKNYISFVPEPWVYHDNFCSPLGSIWNQPLVKGKTRLNILVMFRPLFYGIGPHHYEKSYTWDYRGMLIGTDPVAVDTIGLKIITAKRAQHFKEDRPLTPPAIHIAKADIEHHVGISDLEKIELIKLGWEDGALI